MSIEIEMSDNGSSDHFVVNGKFNVVADGTDGGGTYKVELISTGGAVPLPSTEKSEVESQEVVMHGSNVYCITVAGATSPDLLFVICGDAAMV